MVEPIERMPSGTFGFRARGELTRADYRETVLPTLRDALAAGRVRLLVVTEDLERLDLGILAKVRSETSTSLRALERTALVTDVGWLRATSFAFGRLLPGELRLFHRREETAAREWVAGGP